MNRRQFITGSLGIGLGLTVVGAGTIACADHTELSDSNLLGKVATVRDPAVFNADELDRNRIKSMVDRAVTSLAGVRNPLEAWRWVIAPNNPNRLEEARVAVKVNTLAGKRMSTHPQLALAVAQRLLDAGVRNGNVLVWDRENSELKTAGYAIRKSGRILVYGTNVVGYSMQLMSHRSIGSFFSRIVTDWATDLINIAVLKDHGVVGLSGGMKNLYGTVHNPFKYHLNCGDPYVADLSDVPLIRDKLRLVIVDAFEAQYHGGPPYHAQWAWRDNSLMVSKDPVAIDRLGWWMVEKQRAAHGLPTLAEQDREPKYILTAANLGLGVADMDQIERVDT
jgi:uncharacterized protein (DUF362 family)